MKYIVTSILFFLILNVLSCKKDNNTPSAAPLMGAWELRKGPDGIGSSRDYSPGNGHLLKFSSENKYERYESGQVIASGVFHLTSEVRENDGKRVNLIRLGDSQVRDVYEIANETLSLSTYPYGDNGNLIMDGGTAVYVRISQ